MTFAGLILSAGAIVLSPLPDIEATGPLSWKDAFRKQIAACWLVDPGLPPLRITLSAKLRRDGTVLPGSVQMIHAPDAKPEDLERAFEAARRALLRCQRDGYALPAQHYAQWREVELTFDPTRERP